MNIATTQSSIDYYQEHPSNTKLNYHHHPSTNEDHDELNPKGNIVKPIPRIKRSRSSRKTPTTLLNANVDNFRTLVQQYTGCQRANSSFFKMRSKGPINLNFAQRNRANDANANTISIGSNTTSSEGFGYNKRSNNNSDDYYQETSQVRPEDHYQTFGRSGNNSLNSTVSDISQDMLSIDDYFMGNTTSW